MHFNCQLLIATDENKQLTGKNESHSKGFCLLETQLSCTELGLMFALLCDGIFGFAGVQRIGLIGSSSFCDLSRTCGGFGASVGADGSVISMIDS